MTTVDERIAALAEALSLTLGAVELCPMKGGDDYGDRLRQERLGVVRGILSGLREAPAPSAPEGGAVSEPKFYSWKCGLCGWSAPASGDLNTYKLCPKCSIGCQWVPREPPVEPAAQGDRTALALQRIYECAHKEQPSKLDGHDAGLRHVHSDGLAIGRVERDALQADLARVTADLGEAMGLLNKAPIGPDYARDLSALRARIAADGVTKGTT